MGAGDDAVDSRNDHEVEGTFDSQASEMDEDTCNSRVQFVTVDHELFLSTSATSNQFMEQASSVTSATSSSSSILHLTAYPIRIQVDGPLEEYVLRSNFLIEVAITLHNIGTTCMAMALEFEGEGEEREEDPSPPAATASTTSERTSSTSAKLMSKAIAFFRLGQTMLKDVADACRNDCRNYNSSNSSNSNASASADSNERQQPQSLHEDLDRMYRSLQLESILLHSMVQGLLIQNCYVFGGSSLWLLSDTAPPPREKLQRLAWFAKRAEVGAFFSFLMNLFIFISNILYYLVYKFRFLFLDSGFFSFIQLRTTLSYVRIVLVLAAGQIVL
jgi:hypothetical protein